MILDTNKNESLEVGPVVVVSILAESNTTTVKMTNRSRKKWVRVLLGTYESGGLFARPLSCEVGPKKTVLIEKLPRRIFDVQTDELNGINK